MMYEVQFAAPPGLSLYFLIRDRSGKLFNTTSGLFETENDSNWSLYAVSCVEAVSNTGDYFGSIPTNLPITIALLPVMIATVSGPPVVPASTDARQGLVLALDWSGTAVNTLTPLPQGPRGTSGPIQIPQVQSDLGTAQAILNALYNARLTNPNGIHEIEVDSQRVVYKNANELDRGILFWERKVAILSRKRPRASSIFLGFGD